MKASEIYIPELMSADVVKNIRREYVVAELNRKQRLSSETLYALTATLRHQSAQLINLTEERLKPRTELPARCNRMPFRLFRPLWKLGLRIYRYTMKEEREIDAQLIASMRETHRL